MIGIQYTIEIQPCYSENSGITTNVYQDIVISTLVISFATPFQCAGDSMQESTSLCVPRACGTHISHPGVHLALWLHLEGTRCNPQNDASSKISCEKHRDGSCFSTRKGSAWDGSDG